MKLTALDARFDTVAQAERQSRLAYQREWYRKTTGAVAVGSEAKCASCGTAIVKKNSTHRHCAKCARERIKYRHRRANPDAPELGTPFECDVCGKWTIRTGTRQKRCIRCKSTWRAERQRRINGVVVPLGSKIACTECGTAITRNSAKQKYCSECRQGRIEYTLNQRMSACMRAHLKLRGNGGSKRGAAWEAIVGYTVAELRRHLERQFQKGMTWENRREWEIDHVVPLATFRFTSVDDPEFKAAWAITNLKPLWRKENREKNDKRLFLL